MTGTLDLFKIAKEEQGGDLFKYLDSIFKRSKIQPRGMTDAVIWEGGNNAGGVKPVAHAFTDTFALNGTIMALSIPARTALIPEIVGERLIFNAMAFNTAAWNLSRILGPALAGFMIAMIAGGDTTSTYGVGWVYIILSVLYGFSGVSVLLIKHNGRPSENSTSSPLQDTIEGLRYVVQSNIVGGLILLSILPFLFGLSIMTLLPAFNTDILLAGPDSLGLLMTGMGVGAIAGSLVLAKLSSLRHKGVWLFATNSLWGVGVFVFGLTSAFEAAFVAICFVGFVSAINMSMNRSLVQLQVSQRMRGRVMSID